MKKEKPTFLLIVFSIFGVSAGIIRYFQKIKGFDDLGLGIRGSVYNLLLIGLVVSVLLLILVTLIYIKKERLFKDSLGLGTIGRASLILALLSSLIMGVGAVVKFALSMPFRSWESLWSIVTGALMFLSAYVQIGVIKKLSLRNCGHNVCGNAALVSVFMACFSLIEFYRSVSTNPATSYYAYSLFSYISLILMLFACAGYIYKRTSLKRMLITILSFFFFGTLSFVGESLYTLKIIFTENYDLRELLSGPVLDVVTMLFGLFFAVSVMILFYRPQRAEISKE